MKRLRLVGIVLVLAAGCGAPNPPPERTLAVSNSGYKVDLLFKDGNGVSVYRFLDQGDYRYYVVGGPDGAHMLPTTTTVHETGSDTIELVGGDGGHAGGHGGGGSGSGHGGGHK